MSAPTSKDVQLIYRRAVRNRPDSAMVHVQVEQLITAIGQKAANTLLDGPVDGRRAKDSCAARRSALLADLYRERDELQQLAASGGNDSRNELQAIQERISKCEGGRLNVFSTVSVNVGRLKDALETAEKSVSPKPTKTPIKM